MHFLVWCFSVLHLSLALPGNQHEYNDILGQGKKEWRLAFRGTAHIKESVYDAYMRGYDTPVDEACKKVNFVTSCNTHYRNDDALDNWRKVKEVLFGVVKDGVMVKTIRFNGTNSNYVNWFSSERYLGSCYKDFEHPNKNFFSLRGQGGNRRRFFINHKYNRCKNNEGWFVAIDREERDCDWELPSKDFPVLMYAAGPTVTNWNDESAKEADAFVIFLKYYPFARDDEFFDVFNSGEKEWRLAFRATADVGAPVYDAYMTGQGIPDRVDDGCKYLNWGAECKSHYRNNDALENYKWQEIEQVLFGIVDDGAMVKTITFDASQTNFHSWFQKSKVIDACWSDIERHSMNFFGFEGHREFPRVQRNFYINQNYRGCPGDRGWVVAVDNPTQPPCPWERSSSVPYLLYAAGPTVSNWNDAATIRKADAFVIFFKYKNNRTGE